MGPHGAHFPISSRAASPGGPPADTARGTASHAVVARGLAKCYRSGVPGCEARVEAIRDIQLEVACGEAVGILGAPGAGKSTLLLCLAGMLRPDVGTVAWFGRVADDAGRPPGIAYVPERAAHYAFMTIRETVEYHSMLRDVGGNDRGPAVDDALAQVGLASVATKRVGELPWSAGPRLSLAQALVMQPRLLLIDETLTGLDPRGRVDIVAALKALTARGTAVVAAAETLDELHGLASRVAVMMDGRLTGPLDVGMLHRPRLLELVVATPALARRIFGARVAEDAWNRHVLRVPLEGTTPEAILARCQSSGIRVDSSRVVATEDVRGH